MRRRYAEVRHTGLVACDGIGPTKLDRYGDDILATLDTVEG